MDDVTYQREMLDDEAAPRDEPEWERDEIDDLVDWAIDDLWADIDEIV